MFAFLSGFTSVIQLNASLFMCEGTLSLTDNSFL